MKRILIFFLLMITAVALSAEIKVRKSAIKNRSLFGIQFEEGKAEYYGKVDAISSISLHNYYTSAFKVQEIGIDMSGSAVQLRIYSAETIDPADIMTRASNVNPLDLIRPPSLPVAPARITNAQKNAESEMNQIVYKEYPITTHAKTIEYKLKSHEDIAELYLKLRDHWIQKPEEEDKEKGTGGEKRVMRGALFVISNGNNEQ